jgi:precorrin-6B methylase 2
MAALGACVAAQNKAKEVARLAPYVPTPELIVERMLKLADLKAGERMWDVGSGDGRIVIQAAAKFGADATGVEIDHELARRSSERIKALGLDKRARIIDGDALDQDYSAAEVVTVYLFPSANAKLRPLFDKQLRPGTRIVAHDFPIGGWTPEREEYIEDDGTGRSHTLYLYLKR